MNSNGKTELLIQYLKNGLVVVARNLNRLLCSMKVVMFQLMKKKPSAEPVIKAPKKFTAPRYSGAKNKASVPNFFKNPLFTILNSNHQKINST